MGPSRLLLATFLQKTVGVSKSEVQEMKPTTEFKSTVRKHTSQTNLLASQAQVEYAPKDCYHSIPCESRAKTQRKNFEIYDSHVMVLNDWRRRNRNCLCKSDAVLIKKYDDHIGNLWSYINRIRRYEMKSKLSTCLKFDACI